MKLSLKEFFVHEAKGDQFSGQKLGQNSSSEKDRKANEGTLKEYEDPTSSKRSHDDSKWAGPYSDQERMPHEVPQTSSQENSSQGWEEMRSSSQKKHGDRPQRSDKGGKDPGDLKKFFGGEPYPKSSTEGGKSSRKSSMDESTDDDEFEKLYADLQGADGPAGPQKDFSTKDIEASEPDIDWGSLDDESFLDKLAQTDMGPARHRASGGKSAPVEDDYATFDKDMTFDEFRAEHPEEAEEFAERFPTDDAEFKEKKRGFFHAKVGQGKNRLRLFYMGPGRGWMDMDDDKPSGEF